MFNRNKFEVQCPLYKKATKDVCPTCAFYTEILGADPQTGQEIRRKDCALALLPMLLIEASKNIRGVQAATESARNEAVKGHEQLVDTIVAIEHAKQKAPVKLLEMKES